VRTIDDGCCDNDDSRPTINDNNGRTNNNYNDNYDDYNDDDYNDDDNYDACAYSSLPNRRSRS
jgi:hypothetical protein